MLPLLAVTALGEPIFDGKSLNGGEVVGGGKGTVADGVLVGECKVPDEQGILVYGRPVRDIRTSLQSRISDRNSGFYLRAERIEKKPLVRGFPIRGGRYRGRRRSWGDRRARLGLQT